MHKALYSSDIQGLNDVLASDGVKQFYALMERKGYCYASWASGISSTMGNTALTQAEFLRGTALMGIASPIFQILSPAAVDKLRFDIAKSYLRVLQGISRQHPDTGVVRDINAIELRNVYVVGLERNGLCIENWNLHYPFSILQRLAGGEALDTYWTFLRDTRRAVPHIGMLANLATIAFMYKQTMSDDIKCRQMATAWVSRNPALYSCQDIEHKLDSALRLVRSSTHKNLARFLDILDLEGHGMPGNGKLTAQAMAENKSPSLYLYSVRAETDTEDWSIELESAEIYRALIRRLTRAAS